MLNINFSFNSYINGRPSWISSQYSMIIQWDGNYWKIINWPYDGTPINYTDTNIPLTGWQLVDNTSITATFTVNLGSCCFIYKFVNDIPDSQLNIVYLDCNYESKEIKIDYGFTGSICATSIEYTNNTGSITYTGDICSPNTTCYNWDLIGPVTVYYTDCNGSAGNQKIVPSGSFDFICARSIDWWNNESNFNIQGFC
jgi:hypothetical protein